MTSMDRAADILNIISARKAAGEPFALATVVRTVAATAAKAGAKAVILPDGTISEGWIGGGCARAAVLKAARDALADGRSRLVSVQPPDLLAEQGVASGDETGGVRFASNVCPSRDCAMSWCRRKGAATRRRCSQRWPPRPTTSPSWAAAARPRCSRRSWR